MVFTETGLSGAFILELEPIADERGFFAESWTHANFKAHGLDHDIAQCSVSFNTRKGTVRGMHWQDPPWEEVKIVRCTRGAVYDVILDLRPDSPTFKQWTSTELTAGNRRMLYIPPGFAHGFQTRCDDAELFYQLSQVYAPTFARGVRWNDPAFGITWPMPPTVLSDRDRGFADFQG